MLFDLGFQMKCKYYLMEIQGNERFLYTSRDMLD